MKAIGWLSALLIGLGACRRPAARPSGPLLRPGMTEEQIFDATRQSPTTLLRQAYEDHQVLVLAFTEHTNQRQYRALSALLEQVGRDPRLKYIVLERITENAPVLEAASVTNLDEMQLLLQLRQQFTDPRGVKQDWGRGSLCMGEWAYTWAELLPRIRALNAARPAGHKVLVTTVDGVSASLRAVNEYATYERDSTTAAQFHAKIWRALQRDTAAKAIVVYHIAHTIRGFTAPRQGRTIPVNFLSTFLQDHPDARPRTALLMIAGRDADYQFKFTGRQVRWTGGQPFGVRTAPFRDVAAERGDSVFTDGAFQFHPCRAGGCSEGHHSTATLAEMVDGIVWLPQSEQPSFEEPIKYLPQACAPTTP